MADIDSQMEANGLPTKFESTSNQPEVTHATTNIAATMSNAEASEIRQNAPDLETATLSKPIESTQPSVIPASQPVQPVKDVLMSTEPAPEPELAPVLAPISDAVTNGHRHSPVPEPIEPTQVTEVSFTESVIPSSIPSEIQSSNPVIESAPMAFGAIPENAPLPDQAPISDLRTEPHSDMLGPEAVAKIEEEKHERDNQAQEIPSRFEAPPSPQPITEAPVVKSNGLPSPPTQSPPPAPEPAHASLPTEDVTVPSIETADPVVPNEKPAEPAPTPAPAPVVAELKAPQQDQEMTDVASPIGKPVHEREEDIDSDEPAPKRMKTDEDRPLSEQAEFKIPGTPARTAVEHAAPVDENDAVTPSRLAHMKKVISNLKKSNASTSFRLPVDPMALNIPTYFDIVKKPMDLSTIDHNLKENKYASVKEFVEDFELIVQNCVAFNGAEHTVTQQGKKMESSFKNQMQNLPPATAVEPSKAEKKAAKPKIEPVRSAPRRTSMTAKAASPQSATSPATFAPGPDGVPLIRRDSAVDGRPKRAIVPPKRNSDFTGARPKKKKYELQLRFCDEILKTIAAPKYWQMNQYFTHPVDPVALNIPTYFQVIKKPMDFSTIRSKLDGGMYEKAKDFEDDVRLVFRNCYKFNPEGDFVYLKGKELEDLFNKEWEKKDDWIAAREPESEPTSVVDDQDDDEGSEEDDDEDSDADRNDKIKALQAQIEAMSKQMGELTQKKKKKPTPPAGSKKSGKPKAKKEKSSNPFPNLSKSKEEKKKKSTSKSKPEKDRYVTFAEKQYISNGIAMLPERQMQEALKIIQSSVPALANSDQNEIELDIEEVPNHALLKLLNFVKKYAGPPPDEPRVEPESYSAPAVSKSKKSKPMSKHEQEAQIAELKGKLENYATGGSPDAAGTGADSSDEESDSGEESEEE